VCELMRLMAADLGVDPEPEWIEICGVWQDQFDADPAPARSRAPGPPRLDADERRRYPATPGTAG
jgi:hypothetical protein